MNLSKIDLNDGSARALHRVGALLQLHYAAGMPPLTPPSYAQIRDAATVLETTLEGSGVVRVDYARVTLLGLGWGAELKHVRTGNTLLQDILRGARIRIRSYLGNDAN